MINLFPIQIYVCNYLLHIRIIRIALILFRYGEAWHATVTNLYQ